MTSATVSKVIRRTHMYLALFLTPWIIVYALSGLVLNHFKAVRSLYGDKFAKFESVEEREYTAAFSADADPKMIGAQILEHLGMTGSFFVPPGANETKLVVNRNTAFALFRITFFRKENRLLIEKQPFNAATFVNRAHFRHSYDHPFLPSKFWAAGVDLVVVAMLFWIASGIWMWWEIKPARMWGAVFGLAGLGIFGILLAII
jgi:hypothetical protein